MVYVSFSNAYKSNAAFTTKAYIRKYLEYSWLNFPLAKCAGKYPDKADLLEKKL